MDDLLHKFNEIILQTISAESRLEEEFTKSVRKLDEHVTQSIATGTPVQSKKRPKRLDSTYDGGHETSTSSNSSICAPKPSNKKNSLQDKSREKARSLVEEMAAVAQPPPPLPVAEERNQEMETTQQERRPHRTARVKANQNLKEPKLGTKIRQPSITIKKERISLEIAKEQPQIEEPMDMDVENDANAMNGVVEQQEQEKDSEKRKSNDEGFGSTNEKEREIDEPSSREMSVIIIPKPITKVEVLSDDEDAEKMPPPMLPPPPPALKTKTRTKKVDKSKVKGLEGVPVAIKLEKDAAETSSTSAVSSAESTTSFNSTKSSNRGRKKKTTQPEPVAQIHIKSEKLSTDGNKSANKTKTVETPKTNSPAHSDKSVYEDALDGDTVMRPVAIALSTMPMIANGEKNQSYTMDKNGTFSVPTSNGTFVMPSPVNGTFNIKSPENAGNATFDVRQLPGPGNSTFVLDKPKPIEDQQRAINNASIMTEDNSHIEESPEKPPPKAKKPAVAKKPQTAKGSKKHNELFSLQSPVKTRIEAFEKAAVGSPFHARSGASNKNTTPSQQVRFPSKTATTPLASQRYPASAKVSTTQTTPTAQNCFSLSKGISSSASKLAHLQKKPTLASANLPKSQSLSREPSIERVGTLSSASSSSSLALDEKKKKREEKQRLAQQQREQIEKEKRENAERLMKEKEEKHRKLVQEKEDKLRADLVKKAKKMEEFEKRRHLEELNQRMLADQKRDELSKLEQQHKLEREQAELFKINQTKENYEIKLHKQMYQQKMQQQQKLQQAQVLQQQQQLQLKKQKSNGAEKSYFTFDMIQTDDSTDDESTSAHKKTKRPPLPAWCSKEERNHTIRIQREINLNVIDLFYSVAPMTPDLREIFPSIDARKLKRNSSAVWRTPPRYSQMPKY
ncbi:calponin homology domain-containing protein DDB_G0272472 [Ochlerotatus camptorhynchus]|uniref:calponin homology domain-containing protein DDB_G0272472 n=1 Tax=Ochlerotatus camptorhynchus TaxID=644619 RepID=UPI0031D632EC